ncbi:hypothetical protein [Nocardiopsis valliformis]|uniref:hypothetical protein n=1 Tax=Nocardiopsis valliformis TaxID=239974 RepID=UPI00034703CF|nr:hypothetical protein [Nocardiopsis valliformis]
MDTTSLTHLTEQLRAITDPVDRTRAAADLIDALNHAQKEIKTIRAEAVADLRPGRSMREVGEMIGVSTGRVDQILKGK